MSHTEKKYEKRLLTPEERWNDVVDDARVVRHNAEIVSDINREINKVEGYVIWHMDDDKYLSMDDDTIGWDIAHFVVIDGEDIEMLQEMLYTGSDTILTVASDYQVDLYHAVVIWVAHLQIVPCVKYEGEEPQFDYVNAFRFDRAEQ